jgi:opacity protein-like surface antigen
MKTFVPAVLVLCLGAVSASSQTTAPGDLPTRYAQVDAGASFGHKSGGVFGAEIGVPYKNFRFFAEGGRLTNTVTSDMENAAAVITTALSTPGATATATVKQPVSFFAAGIRMAMPTGGRFEPFALVGIGGAKVSKDVSFSIAGSDVTSQLLSRGVQLGQDLAGSENRTLIEAGLGARMSISGRLYAELSYRYAHIFLIEPGMNTNRIQFAIGAGF